MIDPKDPWPADLRAQWQETWALPHMQAGLAELERRIRQKKLPELQPGHDPLVLAAGEFHKGVGNREIINHMEEMGMERKKYEPLPDPWSEAARRKPVLPEQK